MTRYVLIAFGFLALAFYELSGGKNFDPETTRQASQEVRQDLEAARSAALQERMTDLPPVTGRTAVPAIAPDDEADDSTALDLATFNSAAAAERGALPSISEAPAEAAPIAPVQEEPVVAVEEAPVTETETVPVAGNDPVPDSAVADVPDTVTEPVAETSVAEAPDESPAPLPEEDTTIALTEDAEIVDLAPQPSPQLNAPTTIRLSRLPTIQPSDNSLSVGGLSATASSRNVTPTEDFRIVSGSRVNLRDGPGIRYDVVGQLPRDTRVEVLEDAGTGWVRLREVDGDVTGWVAEFLLIGG